MTELETAPIREGDPAFKTDGAENENSDGSQPEETTTETTQPEGGKDTPPKDETVPFDKHPRWEQRERDWNNRFNTQETRHQEDLRKLREEFGTARKDNAEAEDIPPWFGGDASQWAEYRKHEDKRLGEAEERAYKRLEAAQTKESEAVKEATSYFNSEVTNLEADKTLNPDGKKIDPNKLLKFVMDNDLVDSKGRWNYRAGWLAIRGEVPAKPDTTTDRKKLAAATTNDNKGEPQPKNFTTSADFKKKRPW